MSNFFLQMPTPIMKLMNEEYIFAETNSYIGTIEKRQGILFACLEGVALRKDWIQTIRCVSLLCPC